MSGNVTVTLRGSAEEVDRPGEDFPKVMSWALA